MNCIFCRIAHHESPSHIVYEDDTILCFRDAAPQAPIHVLIMPKKHIPDLLTMKEEDLSTLCHLMGKVPEIAEKVGLAGTGFRLVNNCKEMAGQSVFHVHFHLMGGRHFGWPPG